MVRCLWPVAAAAAEERSLLSCCFSPSFPTSVSCPPSERRCGGGRCPSGLRRRQRPLGIFTAGERTRTSEKEVRKAPTTTRDGGREREEGPKNSRRRRRRRRPMLQSDTVDWGRITISGPEAAPPTRTLAVTVDIVGVFKAATG